MQFNATHEPNHYVSDGSVENTHKESKAHFFDGLEWMVFDIVTQAPNERN